MGEAIDTHALLKVDEAVDTLGLGDDRDELDKLILYINGITELVELYTGREFLSRSYTDTFDGDGTNRYFTKHRPITAISTITYNEDDDEVPADSIKYNGNTGEIYLDDWYCFERGFQNCTITYTAGLTVVPESIKLAAKMILKKFWKEEEKSTGHVSSVSFEGQTINYELDDLPIEAKTILNHWHRLRIA